MVLPGDIKLTEADIDRMLEDLSEDLDSYVRAFARQVLEVRNRTDGELSLMDLVTEMESAILLWGQSRREALAEEKPDHYTHGETA